jgi:hypothetical protein
MKKLGWRGLFEIEEESREVDGRNRRWEGEKYGKKRMMGEMGVLKNEVDWGKRVIWGRGIKQEEEDIGGIGYGRERSMGRRGGWEKWAYWRMRKMGVKRVIWERGGRQKEEDWRNRRWEGEKYGKKKKIGGRRGWKMEENGKRMWGWGGWEIEEKDGGKEGMKEEEKDQGKAVCTVTVALYKNKLLRHIALLNLNGATSVDSLWKKRRWGAFVS